MTACSETRCVAPGSGSTSCGRAAASSAADSRSVCASEHVVVAEPVHQQQRAPQRCRLEQRRAAVVGVRMLIWMTKMALPPVRVIEPLIGDRRSGDSGVEDIRPPEHGERGEKAAERPSADGHLAEVERA